MSSPNNESISRRGKVKKWWIVAFGIILVLFLGWVFLLNTVLNGEWLKSRIENHVRKAYDAEIEIQSIEFQPWKGWARLSGITLTREEPERDIEASIGTIEADVRILPLVFLSVEINRLEMDSPYLKLHERKAPEPTPKETLKRAAEFTLGAIYELFVKPVIE